MKILITLSLVLNIAVLVPVCLGLMTDAPWAEAGYGGAAPARGILLSVYLTILFGSLLLLVFRDVKLVAALLVLQIIYKLATPLAVGTLQNPVVISNLAIAAFHVVTVCSIVRAEGSLLRGR